MFKKIIFAAIFGFLTSVNAATEDVVNQATDISWNKLHIDSLSKEYDSARWILDPRFAESSRREMLSIIDYLLTHLGEDPNSRFAKAGLSLSNYNYIGMNKVLFDILNDKFESFETSINALLSDPAYGEDRDRKISEIKGFDPSAPIMQQNRDLTLKEMMIQDCERYFNGLRLGEYLEEMKKFLKNKAPSIAKNRFRHFQKSEQLNDYVAPGVRLESKSETQTIGVGLFARKVTTKQNLLHFKPLIGGVATPVRYDSRTEKYEDSKGNPLIYDGRSGEFMYTELKETPLVGIQNTTDHLCSLIAEMQCLAAIPSFCEFVRKVALEEKRQNVPEDELIATPFLRMIEMTRDENLNPRTGLIGRQADPRFRLWADSKFIEEKNKFAANSLRQIENILVAARRDYSHTRWRKTLQDDEWHEYSQSKKDTQSYLPTWLNDILLNKSAGGTHHLTSNVLGPLIYMAKKLQLDDAYMDDLLLAERIANVELCSDDRKQQERYKTVIKSFGIQVNAIFEEIYKGKYAFGYVMKEGTMTTTEIIANTPKVLMKYLSYFEGEVEIPVNLNHKDRKYQLRAIKVGQNRYAKANFDHSWAYVLINGKIIYCDDRSWIDTRQDEIRLNRDNVILKNGTNPNCRPSEYVAYYERID